MKIGKTKTWKRHKWEYIYIKWKKMKQQREI
jgi:hypothetical protein